MDCYISNNCKKSNPSECDLNMKGFCPRLFRQDKLFDFAQLTEKQRKRITLFPDEDGTDMGSFKTLSQYELNIEEFVKQGINLYIYSATTGNGKTAWAIRLMQAYINSIWYKASIDCQCLFINVPKYINSMKENINTPNEYYLYVKDNIKKVPLVIFDDIGSKLGTEYEIDALLSIINDRVDNGLSNIYTSNMTPANLSNSLGIRLASRIIGLSNKIEFRGKDKRGTVQ